MLKVLGSIVRETGNDLKILRNFVKQMEQNLTVAVVVEEGAIHEGYTPDNKQIDMATLARIHEYGSMTRKIPPRPFIKPARDKNKAKYAKFMARQIKKIISRQSTFHQTLEQLGYMATWDIKKELKEGNHQPIKKRTIDQRKRRGNTSEKPLMDSKQLYNAIKYKTPRG